MIRMANGLWFAGMEKGRILVTSRLGAPDKDDAVRFPTRWAALRVCGISQEFAGASIIDIEAQDAQPSRQEPA